MKKQKIDYVYHATYQSKFSNIKKKGLLIDRKKNWDGENKMKALYFDLDKNCAGDFAECSDYMEEYEEYIIILAVKFEDINKNKIIEDINISKDTENTSFAYTENIPSDKIFICNLTDNKNIKYIPINSVNKLSQKYYYNNY